MLKRKKGLNRKEKKTQREIFEKWLTNTTSGLLAVRDPSRVASIVPAVFNDRTKEKEEKEEKYERRELK